MGPATQFLQTGVNFHNKEVLKDSGEVFESSSQRVEKNTVRQVDSKTVEFIRERNK